MRKILFFYRRIRDFLIRTLTVYTLYFGLKVFYQVDVGLEWILFIILVGAAQSITESSAIKKEISKVLKRFKNSEILHINDDFIYPVQSGNEIKPTLFKVVDKTCTHIHAEMNNGEIIKLKNNDIDSKINMKIYLNS